LVLLSLFYYYYYYCYFYPHDAMLARVFARATCPSVHPSVCLSHASIVSKRRTSWFLHYLVVHDSSFLMPNIIPTF